MCLCLLKISIKLIQCNNLFEAVITCLHKFKFYIVSKFGFCQNNRSEIAVAVNLLCVVVLGVSKEVIGDQGIPGNQLIK